MALFNFYGTGSHKTFDHKPIYYDPEKEKRRQYFGDVDGTNRKEGYIPGSRIHGAFHKSGNGKQARSPMKTVQTILTVITVVLVIAVLYFFIQIYPYLFTR